MKSAVVLVPMMEFNRKNKDILYNDVDYSIPFKCI